MLFRYERDEPYIQPYQAHFGYVPIFFKDVLIYRTKVVLIQHPVELCNHAKSGLQIAEFFRRIKVITTLIMRFLI